MKKIKYLDLFAGIGGFPLGIGDKAECIGFSEIDKYAIQIYNKNFPKHKAYGDITKLPWEELPDFDLLVGGFPCQSFSIAGKRKGFEDTRGTLFFDIAKGLKIKQPNFVLLENVKGLVSHDNGRTLEVILETLQELGYYVNIEIYNSKDFSVPQNRERIFFLCRHIKTLIKDGQNQKLNLYTPIIKEFLFQILLNNLEEVQKLQEVRSKDWIIGYLLSKEINQNLKSKDGNIKGGITIPMVGRLFQSKDEEVWQNIDIWLSKNLGEDLKALNKSIILTAIKQIIESKTYTYSKMLQSILLLIVQLRKSSNGYWKKTLLDLTLLREHTKKYARINDKKEKIIITETGNAYITSNLQDFETHFIIGHFRGTPRPKVFPIGESNKEHINKTDKQGITNTLTGRSAGGQNRRGNYILKELTRNKSDAQRIYDSNGIAKTLKGLGGGQGAKTGLYCVGGMQKNAAKMKNQSPALTEAMGKGGGHTPIVVPVLTPDRLNKRQNGRRFKTDGEPSFTLTAQDKHGIYDGSKIRRLTPVECERLQGFPDGWTEGVSDTQRYKTLGNAVTVNVIKAIMERLL